MPDYRRRATREAMSVRLDVNGMMADAIGHAGLGREEVEGLAARAAEIPTAPPPYESPDAKESLNAAKALAAEVQADSDTLLVLGTGGAALGIKAIVEALETTCRVIVADTIDPWSVGRLLDGLDLARTSVNVISRSGETAQTMAQFLIVRDVLLRELGAVDYAKHVVISTDAEAGALRQVVHDEGFRDVAAPAGADSRFSVLNAAGLFPPAVAGVRVDDMLSGAAWMDARCQEPDLWRNPARLLGAMLYLADTQHQQRLVLMMPYSDRLHGFASWFVQLWAERLSRTETVNEVPGRTGPVAMVARGATDQNAPLHLSRGGAIDTVAIMLRVEDHGREIPIPTAYADIDSLGYLGGVGLGQLLSFEQRTAERVLMALQRPVVRLSVPQINAFTLGQLFYLFEAAVLFAAALYGVDPFARLDADEVKRLTYGQLGRAGFEAQRADMEAWLAGKLKDYIV